MTTMQPVPAGWFPDPTGRFEHRFWDGARWTEHVVTQGRHAVSPLDGPRPVDTTAQRKVLRQVQKKAGVAPISGGTGHLLDEPVLVVNQRAKPVEMTAEYEVYDQHGRKLGWVIQVGNSPVKHPLGRIIRALDKIITPRFEIRDLHDAVLFTLTKRVPFRTKDIVEHPAGERTYWSSPGGWFKVKTMHESFVVAAPDGRPIGTIWKENAANFSFEVDGQCIGGIKVEDLLAWKFALLDAQGHEVGRITKTWEGLAKAAFTVADNYVVQIHRPLEDPLRTMVIASAITIDCALKQDGGEWEWEWNP